MQYRFLSNLILVLVLNFLVKPLWIFGIDRGVQAAVGTEAYGGYYALLNYSFLFNIILDMGMSYYNNRAVSQDANLVKKYFSNIITLKIVLGLLFFFFSITVGYLLGYSVNQLSLLSILLINQILVSMIYYVRSNVSGLQLFKSDSLLSVLDRGLMIIFCGIVLWSDLTRIQMSIKFFVLAQSSAYAITFIIGLLILARNQKRISFQLNFKDSFLLMKKSLPYALLILLMTLYSRIDAVMIERIIPEGKFQAGIYAQAYRVLEALNMIAFLFASLLLPMFSNMLSKKESIHQLTKLASKLLIFPAFVVAICLYAFSEEIMRLLYYYNYNSVKDLFAILILTFIPVATGYIFGTLLTANGNLKHLNIVSIITLMLNIILNGFLIPRNGAIGAAIATVITQSTSIIIQLIIAKRIFNFNISKNTILKILGTISIGFLIVSCSGLLSINWIAELTISIFLFLIYGYLTNLIDIKGLYGILKEKH